MSDTFRRLCAILRREYEIDPVSIHPSTRLEDLGIDSIGSIELFWYIEDEFNVEVGQENVRLSTVDEVTNFVDDLLGEQRDGG